MGEIRDFKCTYDNSAGISEEVTKGLDMEFPDAYLHWETMTELAIRLKEHDHAAFCELPFCHTVEAEAMGGIVNYGNEKIGPRAKEYICTEPESLLELPEIDFSKGRIHEVLLACKALREQGEQVVLNISGPFTILNVLIDAKYVFKAMRKKPELMKKVFWKLGEQLLRFMDEAKRYGVNMISYADSSGGVNILGPKMAQQVMEDFTYDFLKQAKERADGRLLILLCPKTTFALVGTDRAEFRDRELTGSMSYGEGCIEMIGKAAFTGQTCIKNVGYQLKNGMIKEVILK